MFIKRPSITPIEWAQFFANLADMVRVGIPLTECFNVLAQDIEDTYLARVIAQLQSSALAGLSLPDCFAKSELPGNEFGRSLWNDANTPEAMYLVLMAMADEQTHLALIESVKRKLWFWPLAYLSLAGLFMVILLAFVLPGFQSFYAGFDVALPLPTRMVLLLGPYALLFSVILILLGSGLLRVKHPRVLILKDSILKLIPVLGALRTKIAVHQYHRMLSLLLLRKIPAEKALTLAANSLDNQRIAQALRQVSVGANHGLLASLRAINLVPKQFVKLIDIAERTQTLDAALRSAVDTYGNAMIDDLLHYQDRIELLFKIIIGIVFALIAIAVYLPIFRMGAIS